MTSDSVEAALLLGSLKPGTYVLGDAITFLLTKSGRRAWYLNGRRHRENGPAVENPGSYSEWWINGKRHRDDGPSVEWASGTREWWIHGKKHGDEREWQAAMAFELDPKAR